MYTADVQGFLKFVQASPSAFHAVAAAAKLLEEKGFAPLPDWRDALSRYMKEIETEV